MKKLGEFSTDEFGTAQVFQATYPDGSTAITLTCNLEGYDEPLATLSVCLYKPDCSHNSTDLPPGCFYVKKWGENIAICGEALASGLFVERPDLGTAASGFVTDIPVWQVKA